MAFLIYEVTQNGGDTLKFTWKQDAQLSGKQPWSPFYQHVQGILTNLASPGETLAWEMDEKQMLSFLGHPENHALLIDLKPRATELSLYRLKYDWGVSHKSWTPLALKLDALFVDYEVENLAEMKQTFDLQRVRQGEFVYEFLYLQGGFKDGTWLWGQVGRVNGALLWSDVAKHFFGKINADMSGGSPPTTS